MKTCLHCGIEYKSATSRSKYCSRNCKEKAKQKRQYTPTSHIHVDQTCENCGKICHRKQLNKVCSRTCRTALNAEARKLKCSLLFSQRTSGMQTNAKIRGIEFSLASLPVCPTHCPDTGEEFYSDGRDTWASLDRIDSSKGYVEGNVSWISYKANRVKSDHDIKLIRSLLSYMESAHQSSTLGPPG